MGANQSKGKTELPFGKMCKTLEQNFFCFLQASNDIII